MKILSAKFASILLVFGVAAFSAACGGPDTQSVATSVCASGTQWIGGDSESDEMHPGRDCIGCHASDDGPRFTIAGTVFSSLAANDDCFGQSNVQVKITDSTGAVKTLTANSAGNFYTRDSIAMPYTAQVLVGGVVKATMNGAQSNGACNTCHGQTPSGGAPGRISTN